MEIMHREIVGQAQPIGDPRHGEAVADEVHPFEPQGVDDRFQLADPFFDDVYFKRINPSVSRRLDG